MKQEKDIQIRAKAFAVRIIKISQYLFEKKYWPISNQILRSGTSIGANIYEAQDSPSSKDFVNKVNISLKEARETKYWLDLISEAGIAPEKRLKTIQIELDEIISILVTIIKNTKSRIRENVGMRK